jgi:uncharacterized protein YdeI (YjbR/CyaY-like superfamily)
MTEKNVVIDQYIAGAAPFAREILIHLRALVHQACPQVVESWKWSFPHFDYKGAILCSMAAFKNHCAFGFWLGSNMTNGFKLMDVNGKTGMGNFGKLKSLNDLPADEILILYIREAMQLNEQGVKLIKAKPASPLHIAVPEDLAKAIAQNAKVRTVFDSFSPGKKKEYILWISESKTEATRQKRLDQALEWIAEGKSRNWKYEKC